MPTVTETTLARRIAKGDRQAENELFQRYDEQIRFMVQTRLRWKIPSADIDDLIAEIRAAALLSLRKGGYDPEKGNLVGAYLAGISVRIISQYFRKQSKIQGVESDLKAMATPDSGDALSDIVSRERDQKTRKCLSRLDAKYKEVLLMRFYEQHSIEEISTKLDLERRRVSERINYALKKLAKEWKRIN